MQKNEFIFDNFLPYVVTSLVYSSGVASDEHVSFFYYCFFSAFYLFTYSKYHNPFLTLFRKDLFGAVHVQ